HGMAAVVLRTARSEHDDELPTWGEEIDDAAEHGGAYEEHQPDGVLDRVYVGRVPVGVETKRGLHVDILGPGELVPLNGCSYVDADEARETALGSLGPAIQLAEKALRNRVYPQVDGLESLADGRADYSVAWPGWLVDGWLPQGGIFEVIAPIGEG